jgi:hypothetical protein
VISWLTISSVVSRDGADVFALLGGYSGALKFRERALLGIAIHRVALNEDGEIHAVCIELGTVDAGEFAFAVDHHAAASAHPGAIDHDRVKADDGVDVFFAGQVGDGSHHDDWADGDDEINPRAVLN